MNGAKVAIVGGGMGGLTAAIALHRKGFDVTVYEQSEALTEIGAGIQITPNAAKALRSLGLYGPLMEKGFRPEATIGLDWKTARETFRTPLADACEATFGADYVQILRADMQAILLDAIPEGVLRLGARSTGLSFNGSRPTLLLADGSRIEADMVIGADGIRSPIREAMFGPIRPKFTGNIMFRAVIPLGGPDFDLVAPACNLWLGPRSHVVTYYVHNGAAVNLGAIVETDKWDNPNWVVNSSREELLGAFAGWNSKLLSLLERSSIVQKWALFDCDPLPAWSKGQATLLGDAAHPMLPFLSQGAGMAIEDGYVLGEAASAASTIKEALAFYETARRPRTTRVQLSARERGKTYHRRSPLGRFMRDLDNRVRGFFNPYAAGMKTDWIYSHDVTALTFS